MENKHQKQLESKWLEKNPALRYTYRQWETVRERDWAELLKKARPSLTLRISTECNFYDTLASMGVFSKRAIETFKQETGRCAQVSSVLDGLCRRPFNDFVKFCAVLISVEQIDVVVDLLSPEVQADVNINTSNNADAKDIATTDAVPADVPPEVSVHPGFDWRAVMRKNFTVLTEKLDPDNGLFERLRSKGVITDWNIDLFKAPKGRSNRVAKLLDYIMLKRPDDDFVTLKKAVIELGQVHVVKYLEPSPMDSTDRAEDSAMTSATRTDFSQDYVRGWKTIIVNNRTKLVEDLSVNDELISELIKFGVINVTFSEILKEETNPYVRAEHLLDHMYRRSDEDFARFRVALRNFRQEHVLAQYLEHLSASVQESESVEENTPAAVIVPTENESLPVTELATAVNDEMQAEQPSEETSQQQQDPYCIGTGTPTLISVTQASAELCISSNSRVSAEPTMTAVSEPSSQAHTSANVNVGPEDNIAVITDRIDSSRSQAMSSSSESLTQPVQLRSVDVKECSQSFYLDHKDNAYTICQAQRGKCVIFNMEKVGSFPDRKGTRTDGNLLKELFTQLNFEVQHFFNYTSREIIEKVTSLSRDKSLQNDQCLVMFILSHGAVREVDRRKVECVFGSDGESLTIDRILSPFTNASCPLLRNKPKLVFVQACRGDCYDETDAEPERPTQSASAEQPDVDLSFTQTDNADQEPSYGDFLIAYSTQSAYRSFRNTEIGTWYINALVRVFMEDACKLDVCSMLNKVNELLSRWKSKTEDQRTSNKTQVAQYSSSFRKPQFFFFPGIIE